MVGDVLGSHGEFVVGLGLCMAVSGDVRNLIFSSGVNPAKLDRWPLVIDVLLEEALGQNLKFRWDITRLWQLQLDAEGVEISGGRRTNIAVCREVILKYPRRYCGITAKSLSRQLSRGRGIFQTK